MAEAQRNESGPRVQAVVTRATIKSAKERREVSAQALTDISNGAQDVMSMVPHDMESVREQHSRWLEGYETLLLRHREYLALVIEERRPIEKAELEPEMRGFEGFKATLDRWLVSHSGSPDRGDLLSEIESVTTFRESSQ